MCRLTAHLICVRPAQSSFLSCTHPADATPPSEYQQGKVRYKVPGRPVVDVQYEDGDSEELYLDQVMEVLVHDDSESADDALPASDDPGRTGEYAWGGRGVFCFGSCRGCERTI